MANNDLSRGLLPWQVQAVTGLVAAYRAGSLHPALLVCGHTGTGKRRFAREVAAALLCEVNRPATANSASACNNTLALPGCGTCRACELLAANTHPDLYQLAIPEGKKSIPVDAVREVQRNLRQTAQMQGARVCVIWPAEKLNENAANALLKLLEEPPAETYFLLLASSQRQLLPTISSRCLKIHLTLPQKSELESFLLQSFANAAVTEALALSRGFPERALQLLEKDSEPLAVEQLIDRLVDNKSPLQELALACEKVPPDLLLDTLCYRVHQWSLDTLQQAVPGGTAEARPRALPGLLALQDWLLDCRARLASNPNPRLFIEDLLRGVRRHLA
ncbi:MAG: DNA polymerase III subunit delta' [Pseudomonadales bacterium]|nr:DNA polymerase III subunit delta' [Pseudomonadales bacterium]